MVLVKSALEGCFEVRPDVRRDDRGHFVKFFHRPSYEGLGLDTTVAEAYVSVSHRNVIRGLHAQFPPSDHTKLVVCLAGAVFDVAVDLRRGSPTFGAHVAFELRGELSNGVVLAPGFAHGFLVLSESATLMYLVGTAHDSARDGGIRWDSAGIAWPTASPLLSPRDRNLPPLDEFDTPFVYAPGTGG